MKSLLIAAAVCASAAAQVTNTESPSGNRTTPPTIMSVAPLGVSRGATVEMTIEGFNLAGATHIHFSEPGIKAKILRIKELPDLPDVRLGANGGVSSVDLGPLPPRNQVTIEVEASPDTEIGTVGFRVQTPLGTSPEGKFLVEPYYGESPDAEPNDLPENGFETYLPTILVGTISRPGDVDHFKINVKAGEELVFENGAMALGSGLQPLVTILSENLTAVREFGLEGGRDAVRFAHRFEKAGVYYIRISDFEQSGSARHFYRIKVGNFALVTSAFPLGLEKGKSAEIALTGFNVPSRIQVDGKPSSEDERLAILRPRVKNGQTFNKVALALGSEPELRAAGTNTSLAAAQPVTAPATINGRIAKTATAAPVENWYRFSTKKGQKLMLEVAARRLGSPLDSFVEVVDAKGRPIEQAVVRAVQENFITLRDHDSASRGIRLASVTGFAVNDYIMADSEIIQVEAMPRGPDDDYIFSSFGGQRLALFNTSSEAHAIDRPVYRVQIHPAGAQFSANGLPLVRLYYRNDDGGPGYGKDSRLEFVAPADGDYYAKLRDVRGLGGDDYAYRLTVRPPAPDFRLSVNPRNPNVPVGAAIPVTVTAFRMDGFDGPIDVALEGLPAGISANTATIMPGQITTTLLLSASKQARLEASVPLQVMGRAKTANGEIAHYANPEDRLKLISLMPTPDLEMRAETKQVVLQPGGTTEVKVSIKRHNDFGGRVPVEVRNLPPGVRVIDVGLNGVLINEDEQERTFILEALPSAKPVEQPIYVSGLIETRAGGQQSSYAGDAMIRLKVLPKLEVSGAMVPSAINKPSASR